MNKFNFYRPLVERSAENVHSLSKKVLGHFGTLSIVDTEQFQLNLLNNRMLYKNRVPQFFITKYERYQKYAYKMFDLNSRVRPWNEMLLNVTGTQIIDNAIALILEKSVELQTERNAVQRISGVKRQNLSLKNSDYEPHIIIAKLQPNATDGRELTYGEEAIAQKLDTLKEVTLGSLALKVDDSLAWVFEKKII